MEDFLTPYIPNAIKYAAWYGPKNIDEDGSIAENEIKLITNNDAENGSDKLKLAIIKYAT